jgi:hypothetical protein
MARTRILLADDHEEMRDFVAQLLENHLKEEANSRVDGLNDQQRFTSPQLW